MKLERDSRRGSIEGADGVSRREKPLFEDSADAGVFIVVESMQIRGFPTLAS